MAQEEELPGPDEQVDESQMPNAANPEAIRETTKRQKRSKDKAADFWKRTLADPIGRQEMWGILEAAGTFKSVFACGPNGFPQPEATWCQAGTRDFGLRLYRSWLKIDHAGVFKMHEEHDPDFIKVKTVRKTREEYE